MDMATAYVPRNIAPNFQPGHSPNSGTLGTIISAWELEGGDTPESILSQAQLLVSLRRLKGVAFNGRCRQSLRLSDDERDMLIAVSERLTQLSHYIEHLPSSLEAIYESTLLESIWSGVQSGVIHPGATARSIRQGQSMIDEAAASKPSPVVRHTDPGEVILDEIETAMGQSFDRILRIASLVWEYKRDHTSIISGGSNFSLRMDSVGVSSSDANRMAFIGANSDLLAKRRDDLPAKVSVLYEVLKLGRPDGDSEVNVAAIDQAIAEGIVCKEMTIQEIRKYRHREARLRDGQDWQDSEPEVIEPVQVERPKTGNRTPKKCYPAYVRAQNSSVWFRRAWPKRLRDAGLCSTIYYCKNMKPVDVYSPAAEIRKAAKAESAKFDAEVKRLDALIAEQSAPVEAPPAEEPTQPKVMSLAEQLRATAKPSN